MKTTPRECAASCVCGLIYGLLCGPLPASGRLQSRATSLTRSAPVHRAIPRRRNRQPPPEDAREPFAARHAAALRDLVDRQIGLREQQAACVEPRAQQVLGGREARLRLEVAQEIAHAHLRDARRVGDRDRLVIVLAQPVRGRIDLAVGAVRLAVVEHGAKPLPRTRHRVLGHALRERHAVIALDDLERGDERLRRRDDRSARVARFERAAQSLRRGRRVAAAAQEGNVGGGEHGAAFAERTQDAHLRRERLQPRDEPHVVARFGRAPAARDEKRVEAAAQRPVQAFGPYAQAAAAGHVAASLGKQDERVGGECVGAGVVCKTKHVGEQGHVPEREALENQDADAFGHVSELEMSAARLEGGLPADHPIDVHGRFLAQKGFAGVRCVFASRARAWLVCAFTSRSRDS
ncbi:hypothetical protein PUN4_140054 [Paraburkholderia unamae]|nr:hypothetical protein PUN4_140054 [Paraburkholderia unamae]